MLTIGSTGFYCLATCVPMQRPTIYSLSREVITCINHHLLYSEDASDPEALVNLATTCRYLSDPLLDVIWRELPDIIPLLRLLPSELCTTTLEETPLEPWYERRKEFVRTPLPKFTLLRFTQF